jgi:putative PIN family toxin of toxin-antitoxin system
VLGKSIAVLDTNVVISGIFWRRSDGHRCLVALARKRFLLAGTAAIFDEYREVAWRLKSELDSPIDPGPTLEWVQRVARLVVPTPIVRRLSRDAEDNVFIGCAIASGAAQVVTQARDSFWRSLWGFR